MKNKKIDKNLDFIIFIIPIICIIIYGVLIKLFDYQIINPFVFYTGLYLVIANNAIAFVRWFKFKRKNALLRISIFSNFVIGIFFLIGGPVL